MGCGAKFATTDGDGGTGDDGGVGGDSATGDGGAWSPVCPASLPAIGDSCAHAGASLGSGKLNGRIVTCRAHGLPR